MRLFDALKSMQLDKSGRRPSARLSTVWSEQQAPGGVLREYPRPQFQRDSWMNLNGLWEYAITGDKKRPDQMDGQIQVPFSPECSRSGVERHLKPGEYLWYYRTVELSIGKPEDADCGEKQKLQEKEPGSRIQFNEEGKRLLLHFGAVDKRCRVWWNGRLLGSHENGYLPFSFDVTDCLREGKNTVWVCVQDDSDQGNGCYGKQTLKPHGMFYTAQSGIWQTVWMEWVPEQRVEKIRITPLYDESAAELELTLTGKLDVEIRIGVTCGGENTLSDKNTKPISCRIKKEDLRKEGGSYRAKVCIPIPDFYSWTPEHPFLYDLNVTAGSDHIKSYFAMRKFSAGTDDAGRPRLMLNNRPYFFNGILDQGYWPESLYTPPSDEAMIFDIAQVKKLGFNMMRKHIKIEPLRWYYHCDRLGMVVWQDMINGGGPIRLPLVCYLPTLFPAVGTKIRDSWYGFFARKDKEARQKWEEDCMEMVRHLYNCPCISLWVPFNEGWGQFDSLRITERIRQEDGTRQIDHASGWFDQGGGDVKSVHNYFRALTMVEDTRPYVLSEYGGFTCAMEGHLYCDKSYGYKAFKSKEAVSEAFRKQQERIKELAKQGMSAAVYTQVSDVEEEINGLFTYDRKECKIHLS